MLQTFRVLNVIYIRLNPLTGSKSFCQKEHFGDFGTKLFPMIYSKRHLQHDSKPFFPLASTFCSGMGRNQNLEFLDEKVTYVFMFLFF